MHKGNTGAYQCPQVTVNFQLRLVAIRMLFGLKFCSAEGCAVDAVVKGKLIILMCKEHRSKDVCFLNLGTRLK